MAIQHIQDAKELRKAFDILGREGIALRAIEICKRVSDAENYKDAIKACGEMHALYISCKADDYWDEKAWTGYRDELNKMKSLIN